MRIIVCGGRQYRDRAAIFRALDNLHSREPISELIHGDAYGADRLASEWATERSIAVRAVPAQWQKYGRGAGPIRNREMLSLDPDLVVAFPGGSGTENMISISVAAGKRVWKPCQY